MYPVSPNFLGSIVRSGRRKVVADLYYGSKYIPLLRDIPVVEGSINIDRNSRNRRSGQITIGDPDLYPNLMDYTGLEPYGSEMAIRCGVVYPDGTEELVPMGIFLITDVASEDSSGGLPQITLFDRAQRVFDTSTHVTDGGPQKFAGKSINVALPEVITYSAPGWPTDPLFRCTVDSSLNEVIIPGGYLAGETDRWAICEDMATAIGGEVYFDVLGEAVVVPPPSIDQTTTVADAVWEITPDTGDGLGNLLSINRNLTRENTYNAVVVVGATPEEGKAQPIGIAFDLAAQSKTNWNGLFGKKTLRISNQILTTNSQCLKAAQAQLKNVLGLSKHVHFNALFNPALDGGDIVNVVFPNGDFELHLIDSLSFSFGSNWSMGAQTRTIQYS